MCIKVTTRERVENAADSIIRNEGVEKLTMRRLAQEADVALKTPYNLFGSKTGVLIALLDRATSALVEKLLADSSALVLKQTFNALSTLERFYTADEAYYRMIFWAVMTSEHPDERAAAHANIVDLVSAKIAEAHAAKELRAQTDIALLGEQLGLNLLANLGSWAGGHLSMRDTIKHTTTVWHALLLPHMTKRSRLALAADIKIT